MSLMGDVCQRVLSWQHTISFSVPKNYMNPCVFIQIGIKERRLLLDKGYGNENLYACQVTLCFWHQTNNSKYSLTRYFKQWATCFFYFLICGGGFYFVEHLPCCMTFCPVKPYYVTFNKLLHNYRRASEECQVTFLHLWADLNITEEK